MMKKILICLLTVLCCAAAARAQGGAPAAELWKTRVFSAEELKKYDGTGGLPAYAAVDGIVYDMSSVRAWRGGRHKNMHSAGQDLSAAIHNQAPKSIHHGGKIMEKLPKVGVLAVTPPIAGKRARPAKKTATGAARKLN